MLPGGLPAWLPGEPGHVHDITAARAHVLPALYRAAASGMPTLPTRYEGAGIGIHVPVKNPGGNQRLDPGTKTRNSLLRGLRSQENEDSPCSASAGPPSSASPPAPENHPDSPRPLVLTQFSTIPQLNR